MKSWLFFENFFAFCIADLHYKFTTLCGYSDGLIVEISGKK